MRRLSTSASRLHYPVGPRREYFTAALRRGKGVEDLMRLRARRAARQPFGASLGGALAMEDAAAAKTYRSPWDLPTGNGDDRRPRFENVHAGHPARSSAGETRRFRTFSA